MTTFAARCNCLRCSSLLALQLRQCLAQRLRVKLGFALLLIGCLQLLQVLGNALFQLGLQLGPLSRIQDPGNSLP